jgi:WD40 repeat protein
VCEFVGHTEGVNCVRRKNADILMSAGSDGFVRVWDETTCKNVSSFELSHNWIWGLEKWDENVFLCGGVGVELIAFDSRSGKVSHRMRYPAEISGLSVSKSYGLASTCCFDGSVRIHDLRQAQIPLLTRVAAAEERLTRCCMTNDRVVAGSFDGSVKIIDFVEKV